MQFLSKVVAPHICKMHNLVKLPLLLQQTVSHVYTCYTFTVPRVANAHGRAHDSHRRRGRAGSTLAGSNGQNATGARGTQHPGRAPGGSRGARLGGVLEGPNTGARLLRGQKIGFYKSNGSHGANL